MSEIPDCRHCHYCDTHRNVLAENDQLKSQLAEHKRLLGVAFQGLDLAVELLPVAEHMQDEDWYEKEKQVNEIYDQIKKVLGDK